MTPVCIRPPSSKSLAHRALICAALAEGESRISHLTYSDDIFITMDCLQKLGASVKQNGESVTIGGPLPVRGEAVSLYTKESGSSLRFFLPLLAALQKDAVLTGEPRLMERPLQPILRLLSHQGCRVEKGGGQLTLSGALDPGDFAIEGNVSSQFISGLLFALPLLSSDSRIQLTTPLESAPYVDLTLGMLHRFGVSVQRTDERTFEVPGGQQYRACDTEIEADFSGAAFLLVAAALGCPLAVEGLNLSSVQGDKEILNILRRAGAEIIESAGRVTVQAKELTALTVDASQIPDLVPIIAVLMCFCKGESRIIGAGRARLKESDRIANTASELRTLGADITEGEDFLVIRGKESLEGGLCRAHNDHRIAMSVAVASLRCKGFVTLDDKACVKKSYPGFWEDFEKMGGEVLG